MEDGSNKNNVFQQDQLTLSVGTTNQQEMQICGTDWNGQMLVPGVLP
jgi:hypothetical protein